MKRLNLPPEVRDALDKITAEIEMPVTEEELKKRLAESYSEMMGISLDRILVEGTDGHYWIFIRREEASHDGA